MTKYELTGAAPCVYYVSGKCKSWVPCKSIFIFPPDADAATPDALATFAEKSGWLEAAERDAAVLILPLAPSGWADMDTGIIKRLYREVWRQAMSPDPHESFKNVWCWETLIFAVGYGEGAVFAGNAAVAHPNAFAQAALVNGVPSEYAPGDRPSDRWLLPDASPDSLALNRDIPVAVWLLGNEDADGAEEYFSACASSPDQVKVTRGDFGPDPVTAELIMAQFATRVRWKNSTDGTPARLTPESALHSGEEYVPDSVQHGGYSYNYYTRLPRGTSSAQGMPVVLCLHGHGEPAWMFAQKNGWQELQDETGQFLYVLPDSPENSWLVERDEGVMQLIIDRLVEKYGVDRSRVYLTGFSNGSMATCWYGTRHPQLFAALSPWNSPILSYEGRLLENGWEMPVFAVNGDLDHKMDIPRAGYKRLFDTLLRANGIVPRPELTPNPVHWEPDQVLDGSGAYTPEKGYAQGGRLTTWVFNGPGGTPRVCYTNIKDMPHGAIHDEARAAWSFLRRFRRPGGGKAVEEIRDL